MKMFNIHLPLIYHATASVSYSFQSPSSALLSSSTYFHKTIPFTSRLSYSMKLFIIHNSKMIKKQCNRHYNLLPTG